MLRAAFKVKYSVLFQRHSLLELRRALELPFLQCTIEKVLQLSLWGCWSCFNTQQGLCENGWETVCNKS